MWDLGNRGVVALISVPSGCVFLYNVWGPILVVTISFFLVIYACCSLIVNDSLLSPHAFLVYNYCKEAVLEIRSNFEIIADHVYQYFGQFWGNASQRCRELFFAGMERRRGRNYQLSSDDSCTNPSTSTRNSSRFGLIGQLSPIPRSTYNKTVANKFYHDSDTSSYNHHSPRGKHTSTPMYQRNSDETENRMEELLSSPRNSPKKGLSPMHIQNHTLTRGENTVYFSPEGSPWGTSISPKMRPKAGGVKTVQTVAGPLLASTRYNIGPKVYNDVTSPGLTTRLTKYATEANKKLTHQAQYGMGQFPKVNLQASPIIIDPKCVKMTTDRRTVIIEPPDTTRYSSLRRERILSPPNNASQLLRDKAVKRQASREDVPDLVKKQKADGIVCNEFEVLDETKQKRSRDDSSKSEEDISPLSKTARPAKRTKTPSCYDILSSFSSSKNVVSGVKRKAMDFSRSGTPDFEKHFKSLESAPAINLQTLSQPQNMEVKYCKLDAAEKHVNNTDARSCPNNLQEQSPIKGILKNSDRISAISTNNRDKWVHSTSPRASETQLAKPTSDESVKLTDKLFMRAEPQRNEKLRLLIEEQGNIKPKFTTDDVEEIKKEDIVNMRKTSMKARLQSMFDAISGKAASRINPDVVIQAEEVSVVKPNACPVTCATLNSSTTTTNVNTTPISTSAVVSGNESNAKSPKHVAFNIPNKEVATNPSSSIVSSQKPSTSTSESKTDNTLPMKLHFVGSKPVTTFTTSSSTVTTTSSILQSNVTSSSTSAPNFSFGKPSSTVQNISSSGIQEFDAVSSSTITIAPTSTVTLAATTVAAAATAAAVTAPAVTSTTPFGTAFRFNSSGNVAENTNVVGNFPNAQQKPAISDEAVGTSSSSTQSSSTSSTTIPVFGSSIKNTSSSTFESSTTTTASFTFGTVVSSTSNANSGFSFGGGTTTNSTISAASETTNTSSVFGSASNAAGSFGASLAASGAPQFGSSSKAIFGNATSGSIFGSTNSQAATIATPSTTGTFGGFGIQKTIVAPTFSSSANVSSSALTSANGSSSATTTTSSIAIFSSNSNNTTSSAAINLSSPLFSNANTNVNATPIITMTTMATMTTTTTTTNAIATTSTTTTFATAGNIFGHAKCPTSSFATAAAPIFGNNSTSLFGSQTTPVSTFSGSNVASTTTPPAFGTPSVSSSAIVPTFRGTNTSTSPAFATRNIAVTLAQNSTAVTQAFGTGTPMFGTDTTSNSVFRGITTGAFSTAASNNFGGQNTTSLTFGSTANTQQTPFVDNKTIATPFGVPATAVPPFGGGSSVTSIPAFGNATGVTTAPAFGSTTASTAVPAFGSGTASTAVPAFGGGTSSSTVPTFGGTTSGTTALAFGVPSATSAAPTPSFGVPNNANSGNNNSANIFTFGASQKPPDQSGNFSFTNNNAVNNNATPAAMSTTFQFGAATAKPAAGFNFSAPTTTPSINFGSTGTPVFNAAAPRMFSIGSGTTAPRSRNVRSRRPK